MKRKLQKTIAIGLGTLLLAGQGCLAEKYYGDHYRFVPLRMEVMDVKVENPGDNQKLTFRNKLAEDRTLYVIDSETQHPDGEEAVREEAKALSEGTEKEVDVYVAVWDYYGLKKPGDGTDRIPIQVVGMERLDEKNTAEGDNEVFDELKSLVMEVPDTAAPYAVLKSFEILEGNPDMNESLTRAEMAQLLINTCHLKNLPYGPRAGEEFSDVAEGHPNASAIYMAQGMKYVAGFGDGTFRPEEAVTAEQAVKLVVAMLGYKPLAEQKGGYPHGYMETAAQIGLTEGLALEQNVLITRAVAAQLLERAMYLPVMEQTVFKKDADEYTILDGKNGNALMRFIDKHWRY